VLSSVSDRDPAALRELQRLGLVPGSGLVVDESKPNASLLVRLSGRKRQIRLSIELALHVAVDASRI
jgi:hypothetical protein